MALIRSTYLPSLTTHRKGPHASLMEIHLMFQYCRHTGDSLPQMFPESRHISNESELTSHLTGPKQPFQNFRSGESLSLPEQE
jgi:hypothetical protein